ncbi:EscR/YscR/HrcR family type III secretion system export apparatus protein [Luteimonas sp. MC1782]|uniref:EscR/YscR/HrcR family type III secretion system export apparatus protein n=1 Tax=Luteimonas sp. MC1782 TaxID=2760305 RepID=UPI001601C9CE|nr:EscR/YscR/HrcR family type III secretion system export apparatus protein [Luteimonas sp. MC1782]MBB1473355.1 EscR/YscR/HrcR family type III secretion system export apparatus protein [Luteimonas sp. MC1782]
MEGKPPPASVQAQLEARAAGRAQRAANRELERLRAERAAGGPAAAPAATAAEPPPASPAAADALRAEAEAIAAGTAAQGAAEPDAQAPPAPRRGPLFANVRNGSEEPGAGEPDGSGDAQAGDGGPVVVTAVGTPAAKPAADGPMDAARMLGILDAGKEPLRGFLINHSNDAERAFFLRSAQRLMPAERRDELDVDDFIVVVPAFTVSELAAAFQIGFLIFLPFLVIDLVVANILLALGMMMLSPTTISLPFKLLLFVLIDGWAKLVHGLVLTYGSAW